MSAVHIGSRLELFTDCYLADSLENVAFELHQPQLANMALAFDQPWEGYAAGYVTVLHDGERYRLYYRGWPLVPGEKEDQIAPVYCMAFSDDGITFQRPNLGLHDVGGSKDNNVVLAGPFCHAFSPFIDQRPGVPASERFKALGTRHGSGKHTISAFVSSDGVHWRLMQDEPVLTKGAFDSQNIAFWSTSEGCYVAYGRTWTSADEANPGKFGGNRTISRYTSPDFLHWSDPQPMSYAGNEVENLYTNQTFPYLRAPHLYVSLPMRFVSGRRTLTDAEASKLKVHEGQLSGLSDGIFMTSRGGTTYDRLFMEAFVRPGLDRGNWAARSHMSAWGIAQTARDELSLYYSNAYCQPGHHLRRYTLRTDGFVSLHAPSSGGTVTTKPLIFEGQSLVLNLSTSAAGGVQVELQSPDGKPVPGFTLAESMEITDDQIAKVVAWKGGSDVGSLAGKPIRLRFAIRDGDLYSIQFR